MADASEKSSAGNKVPSGESDSSEEGVLHPVAFLAAIIDSLKALVIVSAAAGLLTFAIASLWPTTYTSMIYLFMNEPGIRQAETIMRSPAVVDHLLKAFPDKGYSLDQARSRFQKELKIAPAPGEGARGATTYVVYMDGPEPTVAQQKARALVERWLELARPREVTVARTKATLERLEAQLRSVTVLINRFEQEATTIIAPGSLQGELVTPLANIISQRERLFDTIVRLQIELEGGSVTRDVILVQPTLPTDPNATRKGLIAATVAGVVGFLILFGVLLGVVLRAQPLSIRLDIEQACARLPMLRRRKTAQTPQK